MPRHTHRKEHNSLAEIQAKERIINWNAIDLVEAEENISGGVEWSIKSDKHAVIVHLNGAMRELETELDGKGKSFGPPNAGEIWIVPKNTEYFGKADGGNINYGVLFLKDNSMNNLLSEKTSFEHIVPVHGYRDEFCHSAVNRLIESSKSGDDISNIIGETLSTALSLHLLNKYGQENGDFKHEDKAKYLLSNKSIKILQEYIFDNMSKKLSLEELSNLVGMTTHIFLIAFRHAFGTTPAQYIIHQRLRRAMWLLLNTNNDITRVAYRTGFSSHSHLATTFKKHFNQTPYEYRKDRRANS